MNNLQYHIVHINYYNHDTITLDRLSDIHVITVNIIRARTRHYKGTAIMRNIVHL